MIIDLTTGQESTDGLGWDTTKPYSDQTPEVKAQASSKAAKYFFNGSVTIESGNGNTRPASSTFTETFEVLDEEGNVTSTYVGLALYTITPEFYFDVTLKSFMLTSKININITENIT
jgi:hypothetical protein